MYLEDISQPPWAGGSQAGIVYLPSLPMESVFWSVGTSGAKAGRLEMCSRISAQETGEVKFKSEILTGKIATLEKVLKKYLLDVRKLS